MDNKTRRDRGMAYITDEEIFKEILITRQKLQEFNRMDCMELEKLQRLAYEIIGKAGKNLAITQPFYCDYGTHITVGDNFFANYNCTFLDVAPVEIGDNVLFGPNVTVCTAGHPVHPDSRNSMYEYGIPIKIESNCWIGASVMITPGVTIGKGSVIGAASVVTKSIPPDSIAAGNPCRVLRPITEADRKTYYKQQEFDAEAWENIYGKITKE